jgi:heme/copper-type cytochrome/quinol oxidase subunit 4
MGFFQKKKNKKELRAAKIDDAFNRVYTQIEGIDSWEDPKKLEHYILDSCEQIIASTKAMERQKMEYRVVTRYLNDIKSIENLPKEQAKDLRSTASRICELEENLINARAITRNITDEQYQVISDEEEDMPAIINRFTADEIYQAKLKRNLSYLEGEKSRWEIEREELKEQIKLFKHMAMAILASFLTLAILLMVMYQATSADISLWIYAVLFICAVSGFIVFLRQNTIARENKSALIHLNQAISMLNVERMKYVNVTNSIEYSKDKYGVNNSSELQYVWEQYQDKVRDQQRYIQNNEDLDFYNNKLERLLESIGLSDDKIWLNQINALIDRQEMADRRHRLVMRRKKIRDRLEDHRRIVKEERDEIDRLMTSHEHYLPEIQEIIKSVDKLCGTGDYLSMKSM